MLKLYIDSADVDKINDLNQYFPIAGVTTNPTILVQEGKPYLGILSEIRSVIGDEKDLFVQMLGDTAEEIVEEAHYLITKISGNLIVKIPATKEGIKAIKILSAEDISTLATTVYSPFQALLAAMAGADYVAPYVNRIDNLAFNGDKVVTDIAQLFKSYETSCSILAASFKNLQQVQDVCLSGADSVTVSPDLVEKMIDFPSTSVDVEVFKDQWRNLNGENCTNLMNT
ncbi:transaldolase family protein [Halobacillus seohaensis]|uniref:Transaldolase family protein n=1 Tax=Halobacillus seohaensis TaxID=447421 RepID=A0ABW2EFH6_9BACI